MGAGLFKIRNWWKCRFCIFSLSFNSCTREENEPDSSMCTKKSNPIIKLPTLKHPKWSHQHFLISPSVLHPEKGDASSGNKPVPKFYPNTPLTRWDLVLPRRKKMNERENCFHVRFYVCEYACVFIHIHICVYISIHNTYICLYEYMYVCMYIFYVILENVLGAIYSVKLSQ